MARALRFAVAALAAALLLVEPAAARVRDVVDAYFGASLVRAELIVWQGGAVRDVRIDRGRIAAVSPGSLRLRELDGTVVTLGVASDATITVNRRPAAFAALRRGMNVTVVREGEGAARFVFQPAQPLPPAVSNLLGPKLVRAEMIVLESNGLRDVRVDRGRITAARGGTIRLRERDGTVVQLAVAPDAAITIHGRAARFAELRRGLSATTLRDGDGPATVVEAR